MKIVFTILLTFALSFAVGCGEKKVHLDTASAVPAAQGRAELSHDSNGNLVVSLAVQHLARPQDLTPAKSAYVVWFQPRGQQPVNQGELRVNDKLEGKFKAPTPYNNFDVFVTAEDGPTASSPSGQEVMRQHLEQK
jgi:hypothetical protein